MEQKRYQILDGIRGFALLNMIAYHAIWDLVYIFGFDWQWYRSESGFIWQQCICYTFILLSGFCQSFGKHQLKRGWIIFLSGCLVSVVTWIVMPEDCVRFGVLTLLGSCALLMVLLEPVLKRFKPMAGFVLSLGLFVLTRNINHGFFGFGSWNLMALPKFLYCNLFSTYLGFMMPGFSSSDYFSIFPWVFLFITGYFLQRIFEKNQWMKYLRSGKIASLEWIGRHSLEVYLVHQPVLYLLGMILF